MTAPIDYNAVLADLTAKRGQIDAAIEVIRSLIGSTAVPEANGNGDSEVPSPVGPTAPASVTVRAAAGIQNDTFFGLSTSAAFKRYLAMMKRPQTPRSIADALQAGGQVNAIDEKTAYTNVATALRRGKDKEFVQTRNKDWGLSEWYGNKPKGDSE